MKKQIAILGSTGSIGTQALQVIEEHSDRYEAYAKGAIGINHDRNSNIAFILSGSWHHQDAEFGHKAYDVKQTSGYGSLIYESDFGKHHNLSTGFNFVYDAFSRKMDIYGARALTKSKNHETVGGAYAQYTYKLNDDFTAINVTVPYKKDVIPYLDELSPVAARMGAVNTIVRRPDGSLLGHNTDYFGFSSMVRRSGLDPKGKKVLVLGSGGASVTAVAVLKEISIQYETPVLALSSLSRNAYQSPSIGAAKGSGEIEYTASTVLMLTLPTGTTEMEAQNIDNKRGGLPGRFMPSTKRLQLTAVKNRSASNNCYMLIDFLDEYNYFIQAEQPKSKKSK